MSNSTEFYKAMKVLIKATVGEEPFSVHDIYNLFKVFAIGHDYLDKDPFQLYKAKSVKKEDIYQYCFAL